LKPIRLFYAALILAGTLGTVNVRAQESTGILDQSQEPAVPWTLENISLLTQSTSQLDASNDEKSSAPDAPTPNIGRGDANNSNDQGYKQPKRILFIIPNYRAVSADTYLPSMSAKDKFWLATQDTFDYSDFIFVGALAGISEAQNSEPPLGHGAAGYGRYYWRIFTDTAIENYITEAAMPVVLKEDPRYYALGHGGFLKRSGYALSRLFVTRTDAGNSTFNISEIIGSGAAAGIGNAYYPTESNPFVKTYQRWGTQGPWMECSIC
jgi:hypothetical protein